ncbi:MAG: hypothetical protein GVY18_18570, partial [Bacteroidetes bacterium]|nr:hypothetical protein [Bacteroidota bacterium]
MTQQDVRTLRQAMVDVWRRSAFSDRARRERLDAVVRLARQLPDGDLCSGPYADLYWHFCEDVADALREEDAALADRLYALAEASIAKEGAQATGAGEGLRSTMDRV